LDVYLQSSNSGYVELNFTHRGGNRLHVAAPPHPNIAPPGNYLLFLINSAGVPSEGRFINLRTTPAPLVNRVGDFDGDGIAEILVSSPWGIGILKQTEATMTPLMMAPNGTRFGGWLLNTGDNWFGEVADYDGDGRAEILVRSPWGMGILKLSGGTLTAPMMQPNGTRFGGWLLNTADNRFGSVGRYGGGRMVNLFVTSPWGVGLLRISGSSMTAPMMQPNGTRFGGWLLNTADNVF
jgi:galactose oxidase-like protein/VCBS repeat protein